MKTSTKWFIGIGAVLGAVIVGVGIHEEMASAAPAWVKLPVAAGTNVIVLPPNATFAIADVSSDPQLQAMVDTLNGWSATGQVTSVKGQASGPAPAGFPADGLGTTAYRATGTVASAASVSLPVTQTTTVWMKPLPTVNYLALITDVPTITQYQTAVATAITNGKGQLIVGPLAPAPVYAATDVDGNPSNPKWTAVVSGFQKYANTGGNLDPGLPGFPKQLRTDGALDYATAMAMVNS